MLRLNEARTRTCIYPVLRRRKFLEKSQIKKSRVYKSFDYFYQNVKKWKLYKIESEFQALQLIQNWTPTQSGLQKKFPNCHNFSLTYNFGRRTFCRNIGNIGWSKSNNLLSTLFLTPPPPLPLISPMHPNYICKCKWHIFDIKSATEETKQELFFANLVGLQEHHKIAA